MAGLRRLAQLNDAQRKLLMQQFAITHVVRTRIIVMNASENDEEEITEHVVSGQVDMDLKNVPERKMTFTLMDPDGRLDPTDRNSPAFGGLWAGSVVQAWYDVLVPSLGWVACPLFTGPVGSFKRDEVEVEVECDSKDSYLVPPNAYNSVFGLTELNRNGRSRKSALGALLDSVGEPKDLRWEGSQDNLPRDFNALKTFHRGEDSYLALARNIISSRNYFFYDGEGLPRVRRRGAGRTIDVDPYALTPAVPSFDARAVRNRVRALIKHKPPLMLTEQLRPASSMSARSLGRSGVPRFLDAEKLEDTFKSRPAAVDAAKGVLARTNTETAEFDIMPLPLFEPGTRARVEDLTGRSMTFPVNAWSFPLGVGDSMSLGYTRKLLNPRHAVARFRVIKKKHPKNSKGK